MSSAQQKFRFSPLENVAGFVTTRPPLVMFCICLIAFAVTLLSLAYYVRNNELDDPDIKKDWNAFLTHFAKMEFCLEKRSHLEVATFNRTKQTKSVAEDRKDWSTMRSHSFPVLLSVYQQHIRLLSNSSVFQGVLAAQHLHPSEFKNVASGSEVVMNVTFEVGDHSAVNGKSCQAGGLHQCHLAACVTFQGPAVLFPARHKNLPGCVVTNSSTHREKSQQLQAPPPSASTTPSPAATNEAVVAGNIEQAFSIKIRQRQSKLADFAGPRWCDDGNSFQVSYQKNPSLTVALSMDDRSVINLHLLHTSYFLLVMVITVFCYAIVRGKRPAAVVIVDKVMVNGDMIPKK